MDVLRTLGDAITQYERGNLMSAESLERSVLTCLGNSRRAENRAAYGYLSQSAADLGEKLQTLQVANSWLESVYTPRRR